MTREIAHLPEGRRPAPRDPIRRGHEMADEKKTVQERLDEATGKLREADVLIGQAAIIFRELVEDLESPMRSLALEGFGRKYFQIEHSSKPGAGK